MSVTDTESLKEFCEEMYLNPFVNALSMETMKTG